MTEFNDVVVPVHQSVNRLKNMTRPLRRDLSTDPYLKWILLIGVCNFALGIWFRVPNFAGPDEYSRLIQPMKVAGGFAADPGLDSLQRSVLDGRALGASFYLYAIALAPVFLVVLLTGQLGEFASLGTLESRWTLWHAAPAWFWTSSILFGRILTLVIALGCIYLVYRIGFELQGRTTGRIAATTTALTLALVDSAHTVNEDVPMLFLLLATLLLCISYVRSGAGRTFLWACLTAAAAVAFKLTGGVAVLALGVAYLLHGYQSRSWQGALMRPRLLTAGLLIGVATIYVGIPSILVGGPEQLIQRATHTATQKTTEGATTYGSTFWILRGYLRGMGFPLVAGIAVSIGGIAWQAVSGRRVDPRLAVVITPVVVMLTVFSTWQWVRVHHLLPTMPLFAVVFALFARRVLERRERIARISLAFVLVTSAVYAGLGALAFTADPRDDARAWLADESQPDDRMEVYENSIGDVAAIHGQRLERYSYQENDATYESSLVLNDSAYTEWMLSMPDRSPEYIQLTAAEMQYLDPNHRKYHEFPERRAYVRGLLNGEYNYTVAAEFGDRSENRSNVARLVRSGTVPQMENTGEYIVILRRT